MDFQPYYDAINLCRHRWTLEILTALRTEPCRFTDLLRTIAPTPHPKTLNEALRRLQDHGLVLHAGCGDRARYEISGKGQQLLPLVTTFLEDLHRWAQDNDPPAQRPTRQHVA